MNHNQSLKQVLKVWGYLKSCGNTGLVAVVPRASLYYPKARSFFFMIRQKQETCFFVVVFLILISKAKKKYVYHDYFETVRSIISHNNKKIVLRSVERRYTSLFDSLSQHQNFHVTVYVHRRISSIKFWLSLYI